MVRHRGPAALTAALVACVLLAAGCGGVGYTEGSADKARGEKLFVSQCGQCHTLGAAGTKGVIGPNLDDAFRQAHVDGMTEGTVRQVVRDQIQYPIEVTSTGVPGMPGIDKTLPECGGERRRDAWRIRTRLPTTSPPTSPASPESPRRSRAAPSLESVETTARRSSPAPAAAPATRWRTRARAAQSGPTSIPPKPSQALVVQRVTNGRGAMPSFKGQLTTAQIAAVAKYVSSVAGQVAGEV